jgi:protein-disulfide isomerase
MMSVRSFVRSRGALDLVATVLMIAASVGLLWRTFFKATTSPRPSAIAVAANRIPIADGYVMGSSTAKYGMVEFADFECPFCGDFARDIFPRLKAQYIDTGRVRFAFRHLPLSNHSYAANAAALTDCAARENQFWPMHDRLFSRPLDLSHKRILAHAASLDINRDRFNRCVADQAGMARVNLDLAAAKALGLSSTPTFVFGVLDQAGTLTIESAVMGIGSEEDFSNLLNDIMARHEGIR